MVQQLYRSYPFWKLHIGAMSDSLEIITESKDIIMDKFMEIEVARKTGAPQTELFTNPHRLQVRL